MADQSPLIQKVDSVQLFVTDLDGALRFYRDELGQELVWRTETAIGFRMPDTDAEIVVQSERRSPEIDLKVASVDSATTRITAAGGQVLHAAFDIQIGRGVVVADPWGNTLVLVDSSKGLVRINEERFVIGNMDPEP